MQSSILLFCVDLICSLYSAFNTFYPSSSVILTRRACLTHMCMLQMNFIVRRISSNSYENPLFQYKALISIVPSEEKTFRSLWKRCKDIVTSFSSYLAFYEPKTKSHVVCHRKMFCSCSYVYSYVEFLCFYFLGVII